MDTLVAIGWIILIVKETVGDSDHTSSTGGTVAVSAAGAGSIGGGGEAELWEEETAIGCSEVVALDAGQTECGGRVEGLAVGGSSDALTLSSG